MERLFEGWRWSAMTVKNVVGMKHGVVKRSTERRFPGQYLIGIKLSGKATVHYRDKCIDYSENVAIFLPKEDDESFEYYTSATEPGGAVLILFDSELPLPTEPQFLGCIDSETRIAALKLLNCYDSPSGAAYPEVMAAFFGVMSLLYRDSARGTESNSDKARFAPAISYVEEHAFDKYIDTAHLAELCQMSEKYFRNYFKRTFGLPPLKYVNSIRTGSIRKLILDDSLTVTEVAHRAGFSDLNYFSRFFKKHFGISPTKYRSYYCNRI